MRILVIGGSDAGISAALRVRELSADADVTVLVSDAYPNFSICGLPFLFSGEVPNWRSLAHRTLEELQATGARFLLNTRATSIDPVAKIVGTDGPDGIGRMAYDRVILATGARPVRPPIGGMGEAGVHVMHDVDHALGLLERMQDVRRVIIIGAGYIGMEMADALRHAGIQVVVVEQSAHPMPSVDAEFGTILGDILRAQGVELTTGAVVREIVRQGSSLVVKGSSDFEAAGDVVLVVTGVQPNAELGHAAGAATGLRGALRVDEHMATSLAGVLAAGDCVETWHALLKRPVYLPLGSTAHKQGRIAGENALDGRATFAGTLGTQVVKIFGTVVGRTGLSEAEARKEGFDPTTAEMETWDHKAYFPGARRLLLRVTGDRGSGKLLGAQMLGAHGSEVSKRLDIFATALHRGMRVSELSDLDLTYTPPLSSPWDPVQMVAQHWERTVRTQAHR
jgi:NADPH-dependent 2,4-dienoyl-CoA reductase/sulfur reductase-like enzyme